MNRRQLLVSAVSHGFPGISLASAFATRAVATTPAQPAQPRTRCVSLRVLQAALAGRCRHPTCTPAALLGMGGLIRLDGFAVDRRAGDIVLFGVAGATARPALRTADWVHALRSATHRYLDEARRFSHPGVSIDPQTEVVNRLMRFDAAGLNADEPLARQTAHAWGAICEAPQTVRPIGLQREGLQSAYLHAITFADATMKSYVNGTLDLPGLEVPSRLMLARHEAAFRRGERSVRGRGFAMSRYWFNAGEVRCGIAADACVLQQCDVRLSTEAQMVAKRGLHDSGERDELADRCAASFTTLLPRLAAGEPIYRELYDIYRTQALAVCLVQLRAERDAGLDLADMLDRWTPPLHAVDKTVPGRWAVRGADLRAERPGGYAIAKVRIPSCGGVNVNPRPEEGGWRNGRAFARSVLTSPGAMEAARPLYWDLSGSAPETRRA